MTHQQTQTAVTLEDIQQMLSQNPLAKTQVENIALQRQNLELQAELETAKNGVKEETHERELHATQVKE